MALNHAFVFDGTYPLPVAETVKSGDLVKVGEIIGVAQYDAEPKRGRISGDPGGKVTCYLHGIHRFTGPAGAVTVGQKVYATNTGLAAGTSTVQTSDTNATYVGVAVEGKASGGAGPVWVLLKYAEEDTNTQ